MATLVALNATMATLVALDATKVAMVALRGPGYRRPRSLVARAERVQTSPTSTVWPRSA